MTVSPQQVISAGISTTLGKLVSAVANGVDAALVGPPGCGLSEVARLAGTALQKQGIPFVLVNCRPLTPWQEGCGPACDLTNKILQQRSPSLVLVLDHCADLKPQDVCDLYRRVKSKLNAVIHGCLWVGNLDCRYFVTDHDLQLVRDPRLVLLMPDYHRDDLLRIYSAIGSAQDCEWGEAIHYFLYDWCGSDLALVDGLAGYLYGNWKEHLYDETVTDCLDQWLSADPVVQKYRRSLTELDGPSVKYIRLLCSGGKLPCHAPGIEHETDRALRALYFGGFVTANLIPGFYQFRNLTVKLLAFQTHVGASITSASLVRKSSNTRVNAIIQDTELSLRHLLARCFASIGFENTRQMLERTKTNEQPMTGETRKSLLIWAEQTGGEDLRQQLTRYLTGYTQEFYRSHNLWTRVCGLYTEGARGDGGSILEPPLEKIVDYLTFNELSALVLGLCPTVFPDWEKEIRGRQPPAKSWPAYLARVERLRNQSAHLRNVTFQDMEDLLTTAEQMRRDMLQYV